MENLLKAVCVWTAVSACSAHEQRAIILGVSKLEDIWFWLRACPLEYPGTGGRRGRWEGARLGSASAQQEPLSRSLTLWPFALFGRSLSPSASGKLWFFPPFFNLVIIYNFIYLKTFLEYSCFTMLLVSTVQWSESALHIYASLLF